MVINEVNFNSVEKLLIMDLFLKSPRRLAVVMRLHLRTAISLPTAVLCFIITYGFKNCNRYVNNLLTQNQKKFILIAFENIFMIRNYENRF